MKIDVIIASSNGNKQANRRLFMENDFSQIITKKIGYEPSIYYDFNGLNEESYYFLLCFELDLFRNNISKYGSKIMLLNARISQAGSIASKYDFPGFITFNSFTSNEPLIYGYRTVLKTLGYNDSYILPNRSEKYAMLLDKNADSVIDLAIDYLIAYDAFYSQ